MEQPLHYLPFFNQQSRFMGLVDSGAQLNLVSFEVLPFLQFTSTRTAIENIKGVGGVRQPIQKWIQFLMTLNGQLTLQVSAAVIRDLPCQILLGMPFLQQIKAVHHIPAAYLQTPYGPFTLTTVRGNSLTVATVGEEGPKVDWETADLTHEERKEIEDLLKEYRDLWQGGRIGKALDVAHRIKLVHDRPIASRPRTMTEEQNKIVKQEVDKMITHGIIRRSDSPYSSEIVLVKKRTGDWRFCTDYRAINQATISDKYPLPRISELIQAVKGSRYFAVLDLRAGYWQIPMDPASIKYTAFRCFMGLYEYLLMPFGLMNAPATFQRFMDKLFGDLRFGGVLCYLDDILVHSPTFQKSKALLRQVFERLRMAGVTVNLDKAVFFPRRLRYLGQIIENGSLKPDPQKLEAIKRIPVPETLHDVRSLIGFFGYYQSFLPHYAQTMAPIFNLLKNHKNARGYNAKTAIKWTAECQEAMEKAKDELTTAVLMIPVEGDQFQIETDASDRAIGGVLSIQREGQTVPVEFISKTLNRTQQNWPIREREAYAIIYALQKFDQFVRGRPTTIYTDHESLKWMADCQKGKIARWMSLLAEYPITIYHKKGKELLHVDFLSRNIPAEPELIQDRMCYFTATAQIPTVQEVLEEQQKFPFPVGRGFSVKERHVFYHGLLYVPPALRNSVIRACHTVLPFNHPGIKKTKKTLMKVFNWPGLHRDVVRYVQSCLNCRRARSGEEKLQGLQSIHPTPGILEVVYMDFWFCVYNEKQHTVLTLIDQTSKWPECVIIPDRTATTVATALLRKWIYRFGVPRILMTDQDRSFNNDLMDNLYAKLGSRKFTSTPYHPQGNATIESLHRTLSLGLRVLNQKALPFEEALDMVLYAYRTTMHSTTNQSPGYVLYGLDLRPPHDQDWRFEVCASTAERLKFLTRLRLEIQLKAQQLLAYQAMKRNEGRIPTRFEGGQLVLCRLQPLDALHYKSAYYKAVPRWTFPFRVTKVLPSGVTAVVTCLLSGQQRQVHISDVRGILPPVDEEQRRDWKEVIQAEVLSFYDEKQVPDILGRFFEALDEPQMELARVKRRKRRAPEP